MTAPPLTLADAHVLDPGTGEVSERGSVVFADGRVAAVGDGARPAGEVIDVEGALVLPGLIDAHAHVATIDAARRALLRGVTTIRSGWTAFFQDVALRAAAEAGVPALPRVLAAGIVVKQDLGESALADPRLAPLLDLPGGIATAEAIQKVVEVNVARGVDHVKTFATKRAGVPEQDPCEPTYDEDQLRAIVDAARAHGRYVMCHAQGAEGAHAAVAAGVRTLEHGTFLEERTLDLMAVQGTYLVPTASWVANLAAGDDPTVDPRLVSRGREMLPALERSTAAAYERGIPIVAGTDGRYRPEVESTAAGEVRHLAEMGLSNLDAIRAATTTAATMVERPEELGRLLPGYAADAVVLGGDPLADLSALADVRLVVRAGRPIRPDADGG